MMRRRHCRLNERIIPMLDLITNRGDIRAELLESLRCFAAFSQESATVSFTYVKSDEVRFWVAINDKQYKYTYSLCTADNRTEYVRYDLYTAKLSLYKALSDYFNVRLPWGSLTGIRPTRLAYRLLAAGVASQEIADRLQADYLVSSAKAQLVAQITQVQTNHVGDRMSLRAEQAGYGNKLVNLYVHIPFCPTRCAYCSFVSEGVEKQGWLLSSYTDALVEEIRRTKALLAEQGKRIFSIYVGGGTPTVLSPEQLYKVLSAACVDGVEYTCEAGRPDTFTQEKMQVLSACGVNRISINPQTLHDRTLQHIGRAHTTEQFFAAYNMAQSFGFVKNVDLIAGLEGESFENFRYSLDRILEIAPENITVHTLCRKRGSHDASEEMRQNAHTEEMVSYSVSMLKTSGYAPYYLYRQKQMAGNLENIGWCKNGFLCVNNVTVMEETLPVYACGAGAISKTTVPVGGGRIQRLANPKDVLMYLREFEERMRKKEIFYKNQFTSGV